ncbi:MAG: NAD(P)H-binding protein [Chloroflexi bacterium]|nr:NAD(P)H-binding protein [Chloroflexota bacterium]
MSPSAAGFSVVTGAFGFIGRHITKRLLASGKQVKTLTRRPPRADPFGGQVSVVPPDFSRPQELAESLRGATTLYNTYWVRFPYGEMTFERAVANSRVLINAAKAAGIRRLVHISITNPSKDSPLPYFKGKALVEEAVIGSGISYAIIRPTVVFGPGDILINNIAWLLRRSPLFAVPGTGQYRLQPVFVEDVADMAVAAGEATESAIMDAVGPEVFTFNKLVRLVRAKVKGKAAITHVPPGLALFLAWSIGHLVDDTVLTEDELNGLVAELLVSKGPPTGKTRFSEWLDQNADSLGVRYASEMARHYR